MSIDHERIVAELTARWPEHRLAPSLGRIQALCGLLGDPERAVPVIQVAGTNGKGSTCVVIESLLRAMGLSVGRFSSPHLERIEERITIDGEPIDTDRFDELYEEIAPLAAMVDGQAIDGVSLTFFEMMTAMAYAAFADAPVDVAVVEVGMGGSWDSTNVADATVAVVCPVDMDHMHILGNTLAEIAGEKAGIIKPGSVAVLAGQQPEAAHVLLERCAEVGVATLREGVEFALLDRTPAVGGQIIRVLAAEGPVGELHLPVFGAHMAHNAALAVAAVEAFLGGRALAPDLIQAGFDLVRLPARLEVVHSDPPVVLDTGHNPAAARATVAGFEESFTFRPCVGVLGIMRDKAVRDVVRIYGEAMDHIVCSETANFDRCLPAEELAEIAREELGPERVSVRPALDQALEYAITLADAQGEGDGGVLIAGSVVLAGQARALLRVDRSDES